MKPCTCLLFSSACIGLGSAAFADDLVFTNESGATATFYGQANFTYQGVDDGEKTYNEFVDNSNSVSRLGLWLDMPFGENKFRFNFETSLGLINTADTNQIDNPNWIDWQRTDIRKLEGVFSGPYGVLWLGQGSMATDGAAEIDNSGTTVVGYANLADTAGAFQFRDGDALSGTTIGNTFKDFDGAREFRIRYDTPDFSGFMVSAAYGQDVLAEDDSAEYYDAALRYAIKNDAIKLDAGLGYAWKDDDGDNTEQAIASGSLLHIPTGLNLTLATGGLEDDDGDYGYAKLGWNANFINYGTTALAVGYYDGSDFQTGGSESTSWGVQVVQNFDDLNLEAYLGYRLFSYDDDTGAKYEDLSTVLAGARWKF